MKKSIYKDERLLGVEACASSLSVSRGHASHMKNLIGIDNVLKKRHGWIEKYHFRDEEDGNLRINGIFEYKQGVIVHAGSFLFSEGRAVGNLSDEKSCGFEKNGLLYIICAGELLIFDGVCLTNAYGSEYCYEPLTCCDIMPIGYEGASKNKEDYSLLTPRRRNRLIGVKTSDNRRIRYRLDGFIDTSAPLYVKTKIVTRLGSENSNEAPYNAIYKDAQRLLSDGVAGVLGVDEQVIYDVLSGKGTDKDLSEVEESAIFLKKPMKLDSVVLTAKDGYYAPKVAFYFGNELIYETDGVSRNQTLDLTSALFGKTVDTIYLYGGYQDGIINELAIMGRKCYEGEIMIAHKAYVTDYDSYIHPSAITDTEGRELTLSRNETGSFLQGANIFLERGIDSTVLVFDFCNASYVENESNIEVSYGACDVDKIRCSIGQLCNDENGEAYLAIAYENNLYASKGMDYFPSGFKRVLGKDGNITAVCNMNDNAFAACKEKGAYYFEINEGKLISRGYTSQGGSLSHFATKSVNLDTLSPQNDNIYGSVGATSRVRRGSNVASLLSGRNLKESCAVEYKGYYCLFVEGMVLVADTRQKRYLDNRLDISFEYEWYVFDGVYARCACVIGENVLLGRDDGRIVGASDGFCDIYYEKIDKGSYLFGSDEHDASCLYLNEALDICTEDTVIISGGYRHICSVASVKNENDGAYVYVGYGDMWSELGYLRLYPNMEIYLRNNEGDLKPAIIKEVNASELYVMVDLKVNSDTYTDIFQKMDNERLTLRSENDYFLMIDKYGLAANIFVDEEIMLACERQTPVTAEIKYPIKLSNMLEGFTVYGIGVSLDGDSQGTVELSYETDNGCGGQTENFGSGLDFDRLSFDLLTFNSALQKSFNVRCFERGSDYLILSLKHMSARNFGIRGIQVIYATAGLNQ